MVVATPERERGQEVRETLEDGRYYLRRADDGVAEPRFEPTAHPGGHRLHLLRVRAGVRGPDVLAAGTDGVICSSCGTTDKTGAHVLPG